MNNGKNTNAARAFVMGVVAVLFIVSFAGTGAALSNSGGGSWQYYKEITISNSGGTLSDYQVLVQLSSSNFPTNARSDGTDIRFTDNNGNELNYWIESWEYSGRNAKAWVKVPSISAGAVTTIRMYYGNPSANSASNGDRTFDFFDDFDGVSLDTDKWTEYTPIDAPASVAVTGGSYIMTTSGAMSSGSGLKTIGKYVVGPDHAILTKYTMGTENNWVGSLTLSDGGSNYLAINGYPVSNGGATNVRLITSVTVGTTIGSWIFNPVAATFYKYELRWTSSNIKLFIDDIEKDSSVTNIYAENNVYIDYETRRGYSGSAVAVSKLDLVLVRKYTSPEPTLTLGAEQLVSTKTPTTPALTTPAPTTPLPTTPVPTTPTTAGYLSISSSPSGASIFLDGSPRGKTPKDLTDISTGYHYIELKLDDYKPWSDTIDVKAGSTSYVSVPLASLSTATTTPTYTALPTSTPSKPSVSLHGDKTDVVLGEDIILKLSALNLITKPKMHVQVIIIPPSGMSVTSSEFSKVMAGQFAANYELEPGEGKDIEVRIKSNQAGQFNVDGRVVYYFGDEKDKGGDSTLSLPIKVREVASQTPVTVATPVQNSTPGFGSAIGIIGIMFTTLLKRRRG